jgi:hypothetical protein
MEQGSVSRARCPLRLYVDHRIDLKAFGVTVIDVAIRESAQRFRLITRARGSEDLKTNLNEK